MTVEELEAVVGAVLEDGREVARRMGAVGGGCRS